MPETPSLIGTRWICYLWKQWITFLQTGFDAELAAVWKPDVFNCVLDLTYIKDLFEYGQLPRLSSATQQYWHETQVPLNVIEELGLRVVKVEGRKYFSPEGGSGDIISLVTPMYTSRFRGTAKLSILDVVSYILHLQYEKYVNTQSERCVEELQDLISKSDLDAAIIEVLELWIRQWKAEASSARIGIEHEMTADLRSSRSKILKEDLWRVYFRGRLQVDETWKREDEEE